jgi:hypothetical protein
MGMAMSLPQIMQETLPLQAKYYDVLDSYYQAKSAPKNDNTAASKPSTKKPGAGNN